MSEVSFFNPEGNKITVGKSNGMVAVVTGITGMDGGFLTELLLSKGYRIVGLMRRASVPNDHRIKHLVELEESNPELFQMEYWDLIDDGSIRGIIEKYQPTHWFNTAAMSHVAISFPTPVATAEYNAVGVTKILEAIRQMKPDCKFLQCSSSEMFGLTNPPQNELSYMKPSSPYGAAKVYAFHMTRIYREGYGLHAINSICFNHEGSVPKDSSLIIRDNDKIDILPIEDLFRTDKHKYDGLLDEYYGKEVWDGNDWTEILDGKCYQSKYKPMKIIQTRKSSYEATLNHKCFMKDVEEETGEIKTGDLVEDIKYPEQINDLENDINLVKFMGYMVGDGYISKNGRIRIIGGDIKQIEEITKLITDKYGWKYRISEGISGFSKKYPNTKKVYRIDINNELDFGKWIRSNIYTLRSSLKKIPKFILNSNKETKKSFFDGYYLADGRKAGHEKYKYKGFTTNSQPLCLGLNYIFKSFSNQKIKTKCEYKDGRRYYYTQFRAPSKNGKTGNHLMKEMNEVINITESQSTDGWFYDIGTASLSFATGPNLFRIHNSRRGINFVTRKITRNIAEIVAGTRKKITLGNLDAKRDWGSSQDYVKAMEMIINADEPEDYVIATRETHTIKEYLAECFNLVGLNWEDYVEISEKYKRPLEVPALLGDPTKLEKKFGWEPKVKFKELVVEMMETDLKGIANVTIEEAKEIMK